MPGSLRFPEWMYCTWPNAFRHFFQCNWTELLQGIFTFSVIIRFGTTLHGLQFFFAIFTDSSWGCMSKFCVWEGFVSCILAFLQPKTLTAVDRSLRLNRRRRAAPASVLYVAWTRPDSRNHGNSYVPLSHEATSVLKAIGLSLESGASLHP